MNKKVYYVVKCNGITIRIFTNYDLALEDYKKRIANNPIGFYEIYREVYNT